MISMASFSQKEKSMRLAIAAARRGIHAGQAPFGACIVEKKTGKAIAVAHNEVWKNPDITAHAEMQAMRLACRKKRTIDLSGCAIYSTCEPCPMCFSAIHWSGITCIIYGASISDAKKCGFSELEITNAAMKRMGKSRARLESGVLLGECRALFSEFASSGGRKRLY